jgi:DNA-binding GntR family transcriptional regulator
LTNTTQADVYDEKPDQGATAERIVDTLEEDIVLGYLNPRERLTEDNLRERFSATRHAVRQALATLEKRCLVERRKNFGAAVKAYSRKEVIDLYSVRDTLETSGAQQIAFPVPSSELQKLADVQKQHDEAVQTGNMRAAFKANIAFHQVLFNLTGNNILATVIQDFARRAHVIRFTSMANPELLEKARQDHWKIIRAIENQDRDELVSVCRDHLLPSRDTYLAQCRHRGEI